MKYRYSFGIFFFLPLLLSAQIAIQINSTNVNCFGGNNGTALATASGGVVPYGYIWNNGEQTNGISSLSLGTYTVTVTDNAGATSTKSVSITQPPLLGATLNGQPQICTVAPDGFSYAIPTGGTPPCSYSWSNGIHTQLNNHLTANAYTVTVTDTRGCTTTGSFTVGFLGLGLYLFTDSEAATCPQPDNGQASVAALSGNGPYEYHWNTGDTGTIIHNVLSGEYSISVTDVNGCSASSTVTVEQENVDSNEIQILIPQCTGNIYEFQSSSGYDTYDWMLNDIRDSIVAGNGANQVQVKWGAAGQKELTVNMNNTVTHCATTTLYKVTVYICTSGTTQRGLESLQVSPNPFSQYLGIQAGSVEVPGLEIQLFNLQGMSVARQTLINSSVLIDTEDFYPGVYWLKVSNGIESKIIKVVKE